MPMPVKLADPLKAGIKTSIATFITSILAIFAKLYDGLQSWSANGNPPDVAVLKGGLIAAVVALGLGLMNALYRFLQTVQVPLLGALFDKALGTVPSYAPPRPTENVVDEIGPNPDDRGESTIVIVVLVLAAIALVLYIVNNR